MNQPLMIDPKVAFIQNSRKRLFAALNLFVLFLYIIVVSSGALGADWIIVFVTELVFGDTISKYPIVSIAFDYFKIGLAFLLLLVAIIHAFFSAFAQVRYEVGAARE